ncbi:MAG: SAM-dependent methyltransferase [Clostridia bacterium]|nr:SAM-dependent methyltransferase [Clostridia bacterium]
MSIQLDPRLSLVASFVRPGRVLADIGTDHAYLPVFLVQTGRCPRAVASDLRKGPLQNAQQTVREHGLEERIQTVLSDGLDALAPFCADDVVLAGMGGILIAELLARASWLRDPAVRVIAQPMSHAEDVRLWLFQNGFTITDEACAVDGRHCYVAMAAQYTGEATAPSPALPYGGLLFGRGDEAAARYLIQQLSRLQKRHDALLRAGKDPGEVERLRAVIEDFERRMHPC